MKKFYFITTGLGLVSFIGIVSLFGGNLSIVKSISNHRDGYSVSLDHKKISNQSYSYDGEISTTIRTQNNNTIELCCSNVIDNGSGWQTILPGGYFYNPLTESTNHNKISGMTGIRFNSQGNKNLSLRYGYSLDNENIIYTYEKTLEPNVTYSLGNLSPSFLYIKNNNASNVDITSFNITYSCTESAYPKQDLDVLMIGNSFSDDTLFYASRVAASYGINLNIYDAYIAGCTINTHYNNLNNDTASYSMRNIVNNVWNYQNDMSLTNIINSHSWDVITFQQASAEIGRSNSYSNLGNLVSGVRSLVGSSAKFYWYQTWAYDSDYHDYYDYFSYFNNDQLAMFNAINDCYTTEVAPLGVFEDIIPAGTAVQNLRTSYMKETFTRDGKHMSSVHGRYLLGLNFLSHLFDIDLQKSPCSYLPAEVDSSFTNVAYEAIKNSAKTPLNYTESAYKVRDLGGYDLTQYTEIDAELLGCSFWNSTDSSNYNKRQSNVSGTSNYYATTKRFTSSDLPVGSLVVIDDSFGIRPEAWTSDSAQSARKAETYDNVIEIDSSFFDGYQYRAFNIFKAGKTELKGQYDQIFDGFHIYVPNSSMAGLTPKSNNPYYDSDKLIFKNNSTNIDAYERLQLDPITGFYKCDSYYELTNSYVDDTAKKFLCTRPFYSAKGDLPEKTVIIVDNGYQWRSDCWGDHGSYSPRPGNISSLFSRLGSSFWEGFRRRTFNVSSTSSSYVNQNYISFMNHLRIYVPISEDTDLEAEDTVTMTALGYAHVNSLMASVLGKEEVPVLITLSGDDVSNVVVQVNGSDAGATSGYSFNKNTGALSIPTTGSAQGYTYGTISGIVDRDAGTISNISIDGSISSFITNNGSITCSESWHDRCNYSTNAASQAVWQRWYMSGSWTANSGSGEWTTSSSSYRLDNDYSMGLRIANNSYSKTRFTLKQDFNNGSGFSPKGISIWLYNPNGNIYPRFRVYLYKTASSISGDHAVPSSSYTQAYESTSNGASGWRNIRFGFDVAKVYNVSFYFESSSSATTYVYLGHVSFY